MQLTRLLPGNMSYIIQQIRSITALTGLHHKAGIDALLRCVTFATHHYYPHHCPAAVRISPPWHGGKERYGMAWW